MLIAIINMTTMIAKNSTNEGLRLLLNKIKFSIIVNNTTTKKDRPPKYIASKNEKAHTAIFVFLVNKEHPEKILL